MNDEIGQIISFYSKVLKAPYERMLGKGVMGKRLLCLLSETDIVAPENLIQSENLGVRKKDGTADIPMTFEEWATLNPK